MPLHKDEQTRANKTHFNLSNFSYLREQQCFLPTARMSGGYVAMASWCLLLSSPLLSCSLFSPAATRCPREHRLCQHFAEPTGVCVVGGEGQRGTILAHTSEHGLGIFHSMIWPLRQCRSDMFPPITAVSRQVPDTLLCQPSSKHLCAVRKNTC